MQTETSLVVGRKYGKFVRLSPGRLNKQDSVAAPENNHSTVLSAHEGRAQAKPKAFPKQGGEPPEKWPG